MAGSYGILNIGWRAMATHRLASNVASHNIANAATPGYSRQQADLQASLPWLSSAGPLGTGVEADSIRHLQDSLLERSLIGAAADKGFASGRMAVLEPAQTSLGVGQDDPVNDALSSFFSALADLAADPAGEVSRQEVLDAAAGLGDTFAGVRRELSDIRSGLDSQVSGLVGEIQDRLDEIAVLNREIRLTEGSGGQANDLRDRRALLAREIGERIGAKTFSDDEGNLNLMLASGGVLVEGDTAARLSVIVDPANSGLLSPVLEMPSGAQTSLDSSVSGHLGGLLAARDGEVKQSIDDLDTLAYELSSRINTIHSAGFGLDGVGGRNLFAPLAQVAGAAGGLQLDPALAGQPDALAAAIDPTAIPGDNRNAQALGALADSKFLAAGTRDPGQFWRATLSSLGADLSNAGADFDLHAARLSQLSSMRESVSGVSTDEEMIELTKCQRAFEAASKIIQTGDQMLQTVLELK